jgi:tetratricopeptide (TPR) repeat protein
MACLRVGVHANAAAAFGKAIDLMTKEKGPDALELASPYINLGICYKRMQKLEDTERCYREAMRLHKLNDADKSEQFSTVLLNMGVLCAEQGRNEEAEKYYLETLELRVQMLGRNHWRVGNTYNNLAGCRRRLRDFAGAENTFSRQLRFWMRIPNSCATLSTRCPGCARMRAKPKKRRRRPRARGNAGRGPAECGWCCRLRLRPIAI